MVVLPLQVARILSLATFAGCLTTRGTTIRRHNPCSGLCLKTFLRIPLLNGGTLIHAKKHTYLAAGGERTQIIEPSGQRSYCGQMMKFCILQRKSLEAGDMVDDTAYTVE